MFFRWRGNLRDSPLAAVGRPSPSPAALARPTGLWDSPASPPCRPAPRAPLSRVCSRQHKSDSSTEQLDSMFRCSVAVRVLESGSCM
ncbi:hypothetical protein AAFF_G00329670 [Aldrovandia affinis]|uniref:Uncharacterized protein n=1 Tax=Aldrovandia affinis TaxID=143900 RepID=A0AAD7SLY5_9TELE|nr:hypothetical protein AAFF_G00329670 [Aldrovandia affinis]